jgi:membrane protein
MARLKDVPRVMARVGPWEFTKRVWKEMIDDSVFVWASALAYAWLFAIFPFFIFLLTLVPYLPPAAKNQAEGPIHQAIAQMLPNKAADLVWQNIYNVMHQPRTGLLSTGILITIWAASGGMNMTMSALDRIYDVAKPRRFYHQRPVAVLLTIVVATLILAVLILLPVTTIVTNILRGTQFASEERLVLISRGMLLALNVARYSLALVLMLAVLAIIYHFGPRVKQHFRAISPGAVFTIAVWMLLGFTFRIYVNKFGKYDKTYGTVGGVAILLLFFYIDALVLLVGAEINSEIDFAMGVTRGSLDFRRPPSAHEPEDYAAEEVTRAEDAKATP